MSTIEGEFRRIDTIGNIKIVLDTDTDVATCSSPCLLVSIVSFRKYSYDAASKRTGEKICTAITKDGTVLKEGAYEKMRAPGQESSEILNTENFPFCGFPNTQDLPT